MASATPSSVAAPSRAARIGAAVGLALAVAVAYGPALQGEFLTYDDDKYVTANARVQQGLSWDGVVWAFTGIHDANWIPGVWLSLMLDHELFGMSPAGYHATNVVLHLASTLLLLLALQRLTGAFGRSLFVAAVFGLHPLHVESVAWISERKDALSGLFWMATLLGYARYVERPGVARYLGILVPMALGLLCKATLVTLPFVLLLLDLWPADRWRRAVAARLVLEKVPLLVLSAGASAVTMHAQSTGGAMAMVHLDLGQRIGNAIVSYATYLQRMAWPSDLSFFHRHPEVSLASPEVIAAAAMLGGASLAFLLLALRSPRGRPLLVGWLWYLGTLVPMIGIVQVGAQGMADRYTYLPLVGVAISLAWGAAWATARFGAAGRHALTAVAVLLALGWVVETRAYARDWQTSERLYLRAIAIDADNYKGHYELARLLNSLGRHEEAERHAREAVRIVPVWSDAYLNLGAALAGQGRHDDAIVAFRRALARWDGSLQARSMLANALVETGQLDVARVEIGQLLARDPGNLQAHLSLASLELRLENRAAGLDGLLAVWNAAPGTAEGQLAGAMLVRSVDGWPEAPPERVAQARTIAGVLARLHPAEFEATAERLATRGAETRP